MSVTLWFMGRPASGKSTLAKRTESLLRERDVPTENLDGDEIRKNLHPDLGFTREDRATNNQRTAFLCKLLNRNDISVVTGMITPFRDSQQKAREIVEREGNFVLVYVKYSLEECIRRDPKGLYEKAQSGDLENFTGIDHPFQKPHDPDIVIDTEQNSVTASVEKIESRLQELDVLGQSNLDSYEFEISKQEEKTVKDRLDEAGYL